MPTFGSTFGAVNVGSFGARLRRGSDAPPTYNFGTIPTSINEGATGTFNFNTTNLPGGTTLYWTIDNITTSSADFTATSGSFIIAGPKSNQTGSFNISVVADLSTEGSEIFTVSVRLGGVGGPVVATSSSVTVNDTSRTPQATFTSVPTSINEGATGTFNVSTTNIDNGTTVYWTINNVTTGSGDFTATSGSFVVSGNAGSFSVTTTADQTTEGAETFTVSVRYGSTSGTQLAVSASVTINDTSVTPAPDTIEYLIVAGGGGGGGNGGPGFGNGGGGGAGGYVTGSGVGVSAGTTYTATVGGGGAANNNANSGAGGTSSFTGGPVNISGIGGGGGGRGGIGGKPGGSGSGAGMRTQTVSFANPGQGFAGGAGCGPSAGGGGGGGGGGGASQAGGAAKDGNVALNAGKGGDGASSTITGFFETFAGGAAGGNDFGRSDGQGGAGGGGAWSQAGSNGQGGGGCGRSPNATNRNGGSGVVIIRYPNTFRDGTTTGSPSFNNIGGYKIYRWTGTGTIVW